MYIGRTILRRVSTGEVVDQWPTFVRTRAGALARLDAATRQAVLAEPGDFALDYRLRCFYKLRVKGRDRRAGHVVLEYDVWRTRAAYLAGDPPDLVNTHSFQIAPGMFSGMTPAEKRQWVRAQIEAWIRDNASARDASGDERDQRIPLDPSDDDDLAALDGAEVEQAD